MDWGRICFDTRIIVKIGPPPVYYSIRWYVADPGAKPFPHPHVFGLGYTLPKDLQNNGFLGPQPLEQGRYYNGKNRGYGTGAGCQPIGPPNWWINGIP